MITMTNFGENGRLGNQLFQYSSLMGLSESHKQPLKLKDWKYKYFFKGEWPLISEEEIEALNAVRLIQEPTFAHTPEWPYIRENENVDLTGYLQSEKYWEAYRDKIKQTLLFTEEFKKQVRNTDQFKDAFSKPTIAISIRRGDYVGNRCYLQLPITYFILALHEHFPNWREHNIILFSDDIPYCRVHFGCLKNVYFSENNSDIEDLCIMSQCDHFIISNSTFSWWGAYLGEKENSKIIRPNGLFDNKMAKRNDSKDFYPSRWTIFDHISETTEAKKIDLKDCCFIIPVAYDSEDRKENLDLLLEITKRMFDTNIYVYEQGQDCHFSYVGEKVNKYLFSSYKNIFHRTKMLNDMTKATPESVKYIFNWDADVLIAPFQILETANLLRAGADMAYPYEWAFARIPRATWFVKIRDHNDIGMVGDTRFSGMHESDAVSLGGAVAFNKESFIKGGMENENFISYGAEDRERYIRFKKLGYRIERALGPMYHINHWVGINSCADNPYMAQNDAEEARIKSFSKEALLNYIETWPWNKNNK